MVHVTVKASVQVTGGPTLPLNMTFDPESYTFATAELAAKNSTGDHQDMPLLPNDGQVVLLALSARRADGTAANVSMTAHGTTTSGAAIAVEGTLLIGNAGTLSVLADHGPRSLTLQNEENEATSVDVLACLAP